MRGSAIFTADANSELVIPVNDNVLITSVNLRYYDYGEGDNTLTIMLDDQMQTMVYGGDKGVRVKEVMFDPPVAPSNIKLAIADMGQPRVLIDHLGYKAQGRFDYNRILWQSLMFTLFALSLWLASILVSAPQSSSGRSYQSIDVLRGVGILLVVMLHATGYAGLPDLSAYNFIGAVAKYGHYGVEIFYVVSAYTLTYSLASSARRAQEMPVIYFWNRRFNRILPTFLFCIIIAYLFRDFFTSSFTPENMMLTLGRFLSMNYIFDRDILFIPIGHSVWWSISTEFQFYVVMPLLFLPVIAYLQKVGLERRKRYLIAALIFVTGISISAISRGVLEGKPWMAYTVFYHFDAFAIGIALAILMMKAKHAVAPPLNTASAGAVIFKRYGSLITIAIFMALIYAVALSEFIGKAVSLPGVFVDSRLFVVLMCAAVIFMARYAEDRGARFKAVSWLRPLGLLSFIVYLVHIPVFQLITTLPVPDAIGTDTDYYIWTLFLCLSISVLISIIVHYIVERPSLKLNALALNYPILRMGTTAYVAVVTFSFLLYLAIN